MTCNIYKETHISSVGGFQCSVYWGGSAMLSGNRIFGVKLYLCRSSFLMPNALLEEMTFPFIKQKKKKVIERAWHSSPCHSVPCPMNSNRLRDR